MSSIFIYGRPGSGKTTLASTMTKLGYRVHFLDFDKKVRGMVNLQPLVESNQITYQECTHKLDDISLYKRASEGLKHYPKTMPQGYLELTEIVTELEENPLEHASETVLVIDSMSKVNAHLKRLIKYFLKKPKLDFDGWDAILSNYEELFGSFYALQPDVYPHCIIISHAKDDRDEERQVIETRPLLDGQFRDKAGGEVEEMYFCQIDPIFHKSGKAKFTVLTKPVGSVKHARTSRDLKTVELADFEILFAGEGVKNGYRISNGIC